MTTPLLHRPRFILIASLFIACVFGWVFIGIAEEVWIDKELFFLDSAVSAWARDSQHPSASMIFEFLTALGSTPVLCLMLCITAGALLRYRHRIQILIFVSGFLATYITVHIIKILSDRTRPEPISIIEITKAFPSGHSADSLFIYGFIGYLLSRQVKSPIIALFIMLCGIALAGAIGVSRLYLNVHWVSDVLGGFSLAAAYLCLTIGWLEAHRRKAGFSLKTSSGNKS